MSWGHFRGCLSWWGRVRDTYALPHPHLTKSTQLCLFCMLSFWIRWKKKILTKSSFCCELPCVPNLNLERKPWFLVMHSWPGRCTGRNILICNIKLHKDLWKWRNMQESCRIDLGEPTEWTCSSRTPRRRGSQKKKRWEEVILKYIKITLSRTHRQIIKN